MTSLAESLAEVGKKRLPEIEGKLEKNKMSILELKKSIEGLSPNDVRKPVYYAQLQLLEGENRQLEIEREREKATLNSAVANISGTKVMAAEAESQAKAASQKPTVDVKVLIPHEPPMIVKMFSTDKISFRGRGKVKEIRN